MKTDCVPIKGLDCSIYEDPDFCDSLCEHYADWKDLQFETWWKTNEIRFHQGHFDEKQIDLAAFLKGLMTEGKY